MPKRSSPISAATDITSRLVDVPIAVPIPPMEVARPTGIRMPDEGTRLRKDTVIRMGSSMMTIGVLFRNALRIATLMSVASRASRGFAFQARAIARASGWSTPVVSIPLPRIISAAIVISASWPNP